MTIEGIGARIREQRLARGWTQEELAQRMGGNASAHAIGLYETGRREPRLDALVSLCEAFGCSSDYLIGKSRPK